MQLTLQKLSGDFTVCKIKAVTDAKPSEFAFFARTDNELSLVTRTADAPDVTLCRDDGWRGFRVVGTLDFSLIGILADISTKLAEASISVFAVSTYDTDYFFVREDNFPRALSVLAGAGYAVTE